MIIASLLLPLNGWAQFFGGNGRGDVAHCVPSASISYTGSPYCSNSGTATVTHNGTTGGTYSASPAGLTINSTTGTVILGSSAPGFYIVTYSIPASGGCSVSTTAEITVTLAPSATISYAGTPYCSSGGTATVTHNGTTGGTYSASPAGLAINSTAGTVILGSSTPGFYIVTYTIPASGGCSVSTTSEITVTAAPSATISYAGTPYCSSGGTATVTHTGSAGGTYTASPTGLVISSSTGAVTLGSSTPGSYTVTYTIADAGGCAEFSTTAGITITQAPSGFIGYAGTPYCSNAGTATATRLGTSGGTYTANPAGLVINSSTGAITWDNISGTYTVTYTIAASGGCAEFSTSASITILTSCPVEVLGASSGNGSYSTLGQAFGALNAGAQSSSAAIEVLVHGSTVQSGPAVLNEGGWASLVIRPTAAGLTISGPSGQGRGLIEFNGADNVTLDGDVDSIPGINRDLGIINTSSASTTYTSVVRVATGSSGGLLAASNVVIRNCALTGSATGLSTTTQGVTGPANASWGVLIGSGAGNTSPSVIGSTNPSMGAGQTANGLRVENTSITACGRGIQFSGSSTASTDLLTISGNVIGSETSGSATTVYTQGINAQGFASAVIAGNTIRNIEGAVGGGGSGSGTTPIDEHAGITLGHNGTACRYATVENNRITRVFNRNTQSQPVAGIRLNLSSPSISVVRNNFISQVRQTLGGGGGRFNGAGNVGGIKVMGGSHYGLRHNSIHLYGTLPGTAGTDHSSACVHIQSSTITNIDLRNNVLSNSLVGGTSGSAHTGLMMQFPASAGMNMTCDHNAYYTGASAGVHGLAYVNSTTYISSNLRTTLLALRNYTQALGVATNDNGSYHAEGNAPFESASDLHIIPGPAAIPLFQTGALGTGVLTDIDSETRQSPPCMGADEFFADCNGDFGGSAFIDNCGTCVGGNTNVDPCLQDCNGAWGGAAMAGTSCDPGPGFEPNSGAWSTACVCEGGTPVVTYDCSIIQANFGDPCDPGPGFENGVIDGNCQCTGTPVAGYVEVSAKAFLDGPFNTGTLLMYDNLRNLGLTPMAQPYSGGPWNHAGTETAAAAVFAVTGNNAIVDWVLLELRFSASPSTIVARRAAFVQRDGDIVDLDGVSPVQFTATAAGDYYLAVRHRNHLGVMTASTYPLSQTATIIDLTMAATATWGTNARKSIAGTFPAEVLWAGDVNFNGVIQYTGTGNDRDPILSAIGGVVPTNTTGGYRAEDVNLDGEVRYTGQGNDRDPILQNIGGVVPTNVRVEQVP